MLDPETPLSPDPSRNATGSPGDFLRDFEDAAGQGGAPSRPLPSTETRVGGTTPLLFQHTPYPSVTDPPQIPGFEILGKLGGGGMGVVYRARQVDRDRIVALKLIRHELASDDAWLKRFQTEAEAMARLVHPNILKIHQTGRHDSHAYLVLEYAPGGCLASRTPGAPIPVPWAARTVATVALAIDHMHQRGVIHRDLKPANVLLTEQGEPKVADFGLARQSPRSDDFACTISIDDLKQTPVDPLGSSHPYVLAGTPSGDDGGTLIWVEGFSPGTVVADTRDGCVLGTPSYMSPEQARGEVGGVGPGTDIYALGAVLYELLTGRPPFREATSLETLTRVLLGHPEPPRTWRSDLPAALERVCMKCLEVEPSRRYGSAGAVAAKLQSFASDEERANPSESPDEGAVPGTTRSLVPRESSLWSRLSRAWRGK